MAWRRCIYTTIGEDVYNNNKVGTFREGKSAFMTVVRRETYRHKKKKLNTESSPSRNVTFLSSRKVSHSCSHTCHNYFNIIGTHVIISFFVFQNLEFKLFIL